MSDIKRCDRCGKVYEMSYPPDLPIGNNNISLGKADIHIDRIDVDMCQGCWNEFAYFWRYDKQGNYVYGKDKSRS